VPKTESVFCCGGTAPANLYNVNIPSNYAGIRWERNEDALLEFEWFVHLCITHRIVNLVTKYLFFIRSVDNIMCIIVIVISYRIIFCIFQKIIKRIFLNHLLLLWRKMILRSCSFLVSVDSSLAFLDNVLSISCFYVVLQPLFVFYVVLKFRHILKIHPVYHVL
jgi:hypothetical protein